jgi:hypothetical protein
MSLNTTKFAMASSLSFSVAWIICSLLVWAFPSMMMATSSHMVHIDLSATGWNMSFTGILVGFVGWGVSAGFIGWLLAIIYNKLL